MGTSVAVEGYELLDLLGGPGSLAGFGAADALRHLAHAGHRPPELAGNQRLVPEPIELLQTGDLRLGPAPAALPLGLVLAYGLFHVADTVLDNVMDMLMDRVSLRAIRRVTTDVYGHILRLPLAYHLDNRKGGLAPHPAPQKIPAGLPKM